MSLRLWLPLCLTLACMLPMTACKKAAPPPPPPCTCGEHVCGHFCGVVCGVCPDDGVCAADGLSCKPALPIGSACKTDLECGSGRTCLTTAKVNAPNGYCTKSCGEHDACPDGSVCLPGVDGNSICQASCTDSMPCRTSDGYACDKAGYCPACVPKCDGRICGDDGCGGQCGVTDPTIAVCNDPGSVCNGGVCADGFMSDGALCCGMTTSPTFDDQGLWDSAAFDFNGYTLLVGGRETSQYANGKIESHGLDKVAVYDQTQGKVSKLLQKLPVPIARPQAAMIDNVVYVAGGINDPDIPSGNPGSEETPVTTFYRQNGAMNWLQLAAIPSPFPTESALVAQGGLLYLIAGNESGSPSKRVDVYDPKADKWNTPKQPPARPTARTLFAAASDGNRIYVVGGWDGSKAVGTVEIFDPSSGWTSSVDLPAPLVDPRAVATNGKLYVFGGRMGPDPQSDPLGFVETVDLNTHHTALIGRTPNQLGGQTPVVLRDGTVLLFGALEYGFAGPVAHPEVQQFLIPSP